VLLCRCAVCGGGGVALVGVANGRLILLLAPFMCCGCARRLHPQLFAWVWVCAGNGGGGGGARCGAPAPPLSGQDGLQGVGLALASSPQSGVSGSLGEVIISALGTIVGRPPVVVVLGLGGRQ
jgi:hypothetical protein